MSQAPEVSAVACNPACLRQTTQGPVMGFNDPQTGAHTWLGIPYAQPPVRALRWKAPRAISHTWIEPKQVNTYGAQACQKQANYQNNRIASDSFTGSSYKGSEDCLYLNIWAPPFSEQRLPVMVWIHGGGDIFGSGEIESGGKLPVAENVILVSFNYRLGIFGWLSHPALKASADNPAEASGNFGTLDMIEALRWVKNNIAHFGGNPDCVTLFGCSAGAWNVLSLIESPLAKGLFHRAIVQGGWPKKSSVAHAENYVDDKTPGHPQSASELLLHLVAQKNPELNREALKQAVSELSAEDVVDFLQQKSYEDFERAYLVLEDQYREAYYLKEALFDTKLGRHIHECSHSVPKIFCDGHVITDTDIHQAIKAGRHNDVPVLLGTNRNESTLFQVIDPEFVETVSGKRVINNLPRYQLADEYVSNLWTVSGADELVNSFAQYQQSPVFVYRFEWHQFPEVNGEDLSTLLGAAHGLECAAILGADQLPYADVPVAEDFKTLSAAMMAYWAAFARSGNPSASISQPLPTWSPWEYGDNTGDKKMHLAAAAQGGLRMSPEHNTRQGVMAKATADPRLSEQTVRHQLYRDVLDHAHTFLTHDDYQQLIAEQPQD